MPSSPNSLKSKTLSLVSTTILIEGSEIKERLQVLSVTIEQDLNRIPFAKIKMLDGGSADGEKFTASESSSYEPGKEVTIKAGYENKTETIFKGIITKHSLKIDRKGRSLLIIECRHKAVKMTIGRKQEVFVKLKDSEIISKIIQEYGLTKDVEASTHPHEQLVQHYASDWDFVMTRADINGWVVYPDLEKIIIKTPNFSASPKYDVTYGLTLYEIDIEVDARNQFKKATAIGWDAAAQKITKANGNANSATLGGNFTSSKLANVIGLKDFLIHTPADIPSKMLDTWATAKLTKSKMAMIQGTAVFKGVSGLIPGDILELKGLSKRFNGKVFISGIRHIIEEGDWMIEARIGLSEEWYAETTPNIDSSVNSAYSPSVQGLSIGVVKKIHEDKQGNYRIQIVMPTLEKDSNPIWARLSTIYANNGAGVFFYPEIGDEVVVGFLNNDPQNPIVVGNLFSKKNKSPLEPNEKNNEKAIITKSQLKIHFEDEKKILSLETPAGNKMKFDDDEKSIVIEDQHGNKIQMNDAGITIESSKDIIFKAKGKMTVEAKQDIELKSEGGNLKGEAMEVALKGKTKFAAEGAMAELKGSGQTTIKGGMVMIN